MGTRFARFLDGRRIAYGVAGEDSIEEISSTPFLPFEKTGITHGFGDVRMLAPCLPSKIVAIGLNYSAHARELKMDIPDHPMFFFKPSTAVIGPKDTIKWPPDCERLDYEGELAVVIGSVARSVSKERAGEVILGYTCGIDATARDQQQSDKQWGRAKGFDTSAPLGPWIATDIDPSSLQLITTVNGEVKQQANTSDMIFDVGALVEFITASVTLLPGDVIMTGTPAGAGPVEPADKVSVEIEGIGVLESTVSKRPEKRGKKSDG